jgi:hypothetical protein
VPARTTTGSDFACTPPDTVTGPWPDAEPEGEAAGPGEEEAEPAACSPCGDAADASAVAASSSSRSASAVVRAGTVTPAVNDDDDAAATGPPLPSLSSPPTRNVKWAGELLLAAAPAAPAPAAPGLAPGLARALPRDPLLVAGEGAALLGEREGANELPARRVPEAVAVAPCELPLLPAAPPAAAAAPGEAVRLRCAAGVAEAASAAAQRGGGEIERERTAVSRHTYETAPRRLTEWD